MKKSVNIAFPMHASKPKAPAAKSGRRKTKIKYFSVAEVRRLFRAIPKKKLRDRLLFDLIYHYALRRTEACLLRLEDFNLKANTVEVHRLKGSDSHSYPLFPTTKRLVTEYLAQPRTEWTRHLFQSRQRHGEPISASLVAHLFRQYAKRADLPPNKSVHALRHSLAMHMGEGGLDGVDMQDWMGHVSWNSTRIYMHVSARRRRKTLRRMIASGEIA